jgi:heme/copper-type cytochrome/quinol oxidase subunit 3
MTRTPVTIDVSDLPRVVFGHKNLVWWGTMGLVAIESTVFVLLLASYYYLRGRVPSWPPGLLPPELRWGTVNLVLFLVSAVPNQLTKRAAERFDLTWSRIWLGVTTAFAVATIVVRALEFPALNVSWNTNAYGSIVWTLMGVHTLHLITDAYDTALLNVLAFTGPVEAKRFVDFSDNALYWYFVVLSWVPLYATIYLAPRYL